MAGKEVISLDTHCSETLCDRTKGDWGNDLFPIQPQFHTDTTSGACDQETSLLGFTSDICPPVVTVFGPGF